VGYYIYTGSALNGLESRLDRHLSSPSSGKRHWHIDYLSAWAEDKSCAVVLTPGRLECELNRAVAAIPGARLVAPGFGSSDCRCPSHLYLLPGAVWPDYPGQEILR
jgi:Uri superfamily endonuclease